MFSIFLYADIDFQFVFGFLCGIILMCSGYFIEKRQVRTAAGLVFTAAALALLDFPYFIGIGHRRFLAVLLQSFAAWRSF